MAGGAETIKEFLVSLVYQSNRETEKSFTEALEGATTRAELLSHAIERAADAVAEAVISVSEDFEHLYYASGRIHSTVGSIQAFIYAATQMGATADEAEASLKSFARTLDLNPGEERHLQQLGIQTRINGVIRDRADLARDLGRVLSAMPAWQQKAIGMDEYGLSANVLRAITKSDEFSENFEDKNSFARRIGLDPEKAAEDAHKFRDVWTRTFDDLGQEADRLQTTAMSRLTGPLTRFDEFLRANAPEFDRVVTQMTIQIEGLGTDIGSIFTDEGPNGIPNATTALRWFDDQLISGVKGLREFVVSVKDLIHWMEQLDQASKDWTIVKILNFLAAGHNPMGAFTDLPGVSPDSSVNPDGWWDRTKKAWQGVKSLFGGGGGGSADAGSAPTGGPTGARGDRLSTAMDAAMDQLRKEGVPEANLRAAAALLIGQADAESGVNPRQVHDNGTGYGIYGARLGRRDAMFAWLKENGFAQDDLAGQAKYMAHEAMTGDSFGPTRRMLMTADKSNFGPATSVIRGNFESPAPGAERDQDRYAGTVAAFGAHPAASLDGAPAGAKHSFKLPDGTQVFTDAEGKVVGGWPSYGGLQMQYDPTTGGMSATPGTGGDKTIHQQVDIHVNGAGDPHAVAGAVGYHIERTNQDFARFLQGAAQ